jgi:hypothetical protein
MRDLVDQLHEKERAMRRSEWINEWTY